MVYVEVDVTASDHPRCLCGRRGKADMDGRLRQLRWPPLTALTPVGATDSNVSAAATALRDAANKVEAVNRRHRKAASAAASAADRRRNPRRRGRGRGQALRVCAASWRTPERATGDLAYVKR